MCLDSLFINLFCAHAGFERSTGREWHNLSGTPDCLGDPLEKSYHDVGNSKTKKLRQQWIIYFSMFPLHTVALKRGENMFGFWTDTNRHPAHTRQNSLKAKF